MKLAIFDIDGTITSTSMERLFIGFLLQSRVISPWKITTSAIEFVRHQPSVWKHGFKQNKIYLRNLDVLLVRQMAELCFRQRIRKTIRSKMELEITSRQTSGYKILLLSGSLSILAQLMTTYFSADYFIGTSLEERNGKYTGRIAGLHPYGQNKKDIAEKFCHQHGFRLDEAAAYGNEYSDAFLMNASAEPAAVAPDKHLRQWAERKQWRILD